jgi:hypothetical protein
LNEKRQIHFVIGCRKVQLEEEEGLVILFCIGNGLLG